MTLEDLKKNSVFAVGGENVDYAQYFDGMSYLNMLSLKQVIGTFIMRQKGADRCCW